MPTDANILFVSIKPRFIEKILAGEKSVELRRVRPSVQPGARIIFYASSPSREVVATARIKAIDAGRPTAIWERHRAEVGLPRSEYRNYFAGASQAVGILLEEIERLPHPLPLADLRERLDGFEPPQSFRYIDDTQAAAVI
jgi:predicted transcriptional regulator